MEGNTGWVGRNVICSNFKGANRGETFFQYFTYKAYNPPPPPLVIFIFYVNFCYALCHRWNYPPIICFNIFIFDPAQQIPSLGKKQSLIYPAHGCQSRNKKIAMALVASSMA
jgi:hypothetical protein